MTSGNSDKTLQITLCGALLFHFYSLFNSLLTCLLGLSLTFQILPLLFSRMSYLFLREPQRKELNSSGNARSLICRALSPKPPYEQNIACRTSCSSKIVGWRASLYKFSKITQFTLSCQMESLIKIQYPPSFCPFPTVGRSWGMSNII